MRRYAQMLKDYLEDQHPKAYKELLRRGELESYLESRAQAAADQRIIMMQTGMDVQAAEEVVLQDLLTLP